MPNPCPALETEYQRPPPLAQAWGPTLASPQHETLLEALAAGEAAAAPFLTFHNGSEFEPVDARATARGVRRAAAVLRAEGVQRGERVVLMMPTSKEFIHALLGAMWIGAIPVPLASPMTFGSLDSFVANLGTIIKHSDARCLVTSTRIRNGIKADSALAHGLRVVLSPADLGATSRASELPVSVDGRDTAFIQYTSGTTGRPKGAVISHRAVMHNAQAIVHGLRITPNDVGASWLPLFHDMGLIGVVLTALCHPYPVHILRPEHFLMAPDSWLRLIEQVGATLTAAPNFAYDLCVTRNRRQHKGLACLRAVLNGAEPVHTQTAERFDRAFASAGYQAAAMTPVYGMAENTLAITMAEPGQGIAGRPLDRRTLERGGRAVPAQAGAAYQAVSVGRPIAGVGIRVVDQQGRVLPEGQVGEICVGGASLMDGYFNAPEQSAQTLSEGWLLTGDLGVMLDSELYVTGREKEVIIKAGRNIYPYDLERVAAEVDGVVRGGVAAFARPNPDTGTDDVVLFVETRERATDERDRLQKEVRGELLRSLGIKADRVVLRPVGTLPRTTSGKIRRRSCAAMLSQECDG